MSLSSSIEIFRERLIKFQDPFIKLKSLYDNSAIDFIINNYLSNLPFPKTIKILSFPITHLPVHDVVLL